MSIVTALIAMGVLALIFGGHWFTRVIMEYTNELFLSIPTVVG